MYHDKTVGVVIPAHNEAPSITAVVNDLREQAAVDHIVVCDNASHDATAKLAQMAGATVVREPQKGYGAACLRALSVLPECDWIVFVDGDRAMRGSDLSQLLLALNDGAQLVIGSRTLGAQKGWVESGALTPHQRFGNWLAAKLSTWVWLRGTNQQVTDLGPYRAITQVALAQLEMQDKAYGWTMEMQAKALAKSLPMVEVPVASLRRIGSSKVSGTWRGSLGAAVGILGALMRIGAPALWAQLLQSITIKPREKEPQVSTLKWKKPS